MKDKLWPFSEPVTRVMIILVVAWLLNILMTHDIFVLR